MTDPTRPGQSPAPYRETTGDSFAETFATGATATPIRRGVLLTGRCPRCSDRMQFPVVTEIFQTTIVPTTGPAPAAAEEKPLMCTCQEPHPDRPAGEVGCGAYWNIRLTRSPS
jgi:hypothetical protein